jgi:hypothetical protein
MLARTKAVSTRIALLGAALASTFALLVAINPGTAAASNGFCQGVYITSTCTGPGPGPVTQIDAEVLEGSATICVRLNEGDGVFVYKSCGLDRASTEAYGVTGYPEILTEGAGVVVTGIYNT